MASKKLLLILDTDQHAHPLIDFMTVNAKTFGWKLRVGTLAEAGTLDRIRVKYNDRLECTGFKDYQACEQAIRKTDLVIAMIPDTILLQVADSCIRYRKALVSPARLTRQMAMKKAQAKENGALILMDCGFSPGLDHIIAKKAIDNIHAKGGTMLSFRTYSGVLLSEPLDANPWQWKLTESVTDLMTFGKHTNRHLIKGRLQHIPCHRLFERAERIAVGELDNIVAIPEGDSLYYKKIYDLTDAHTVIRAKLVRNGFQQTWDRLIRLGLTDGTSRLDLSTLASSSRIVDALLPARLTGSLEDRVREYTGAEEEDIEKLRWLGLFEDERPTEASGEVTPAQILQSLLLKKLSLEPDDKDCAVMQHHLGYEFREDHYEMTALLVLPGEDATNSALARLTGLTCGAAAKSVLLGAIKIKGLHIPVLREIYDPILNELEELGIAFQMTEKKQIVNEDVATAGNG